MAEDPNWPRASSWLRGEGVSDMTASLAVLGVPLHLGSITPGRCDLAPAAIRAALERFSTYDFDEEVDVRGLLADDLGDVLVADMRPEQAFDPISKAVRRAVGDHEAVILLGGDNAVTWAGVHGLGVRLERCALLTLDAHLDLRDLDAGLSNGNPVRALLADGLPGDHVVQVGIQSFANSPEYAEVAREAGIQLITAGAVRKQSIEFVVAESLAHLSDRADAIYVDLDLDVMDRAFAPGTPGSRPGGLTPADIRTAAHLCGRHPKVRALDLVELDPSKDIADATALAGAACLLSFASGVLRRMHAGGRA